uniref:Retrovirus-related Pol polyprotein from transposon TNT 1-94 n=1 Tax=Tanacetum cinerariifolium TaxID=118510 RepID=A0A699I2Q1_TANCI|nr:hypothetical protein [Tanacetum cinerariifolium]
MTKSLWIEAMKEEIHEFKRLEVWELVPRPSNIMIIAFKWIFKVKLDEYREHDSLSDGYEDDISDGILKEEVGLWYPKDTEFDLTAFADADHVGCQDSRKTTSGRCCAQILWMHSQLSDYRFDFNKILLYCDSQSVIALSCNMVQHSKMKHTTVRYHFIKEQDENEVVKLYFVKTASQLADIFTKSLARERFEFLINCLGMQSITPKDLKLLADSEEEL